MTLFPLPGLDEFEGIRDAAPDAWGRRVIEANLPVPTNSLDEFSLGSVIRKLEDIASAALVKELRRAD